MDFITLVYTGVLSLAGNHQLAVVWVETREGGHSDTGQFHGLLCVDSGDNGSNVCQSTWLTNWLKATSCSSEALITQIHISRWLQLGR